MANINVRRSESEQRDTARRDDRSIARRSDEALFSSNPFSLMRRMHDEMDRMFADAFGGGFWGPWGAGQRAAGGMMSRWSPAIDVSEHEGNLVVCADLPGLSKDDVQVEVTDDALTISGERKQEREEIRGGFRQTERSYGRFQRVIPLPEGVKADQAKAHFKDGVLEVRMPVEEQRSRSRRITIEGGVQAGGGTAQPEMARQEQRKGQR